MREGPPPARLPRDATSRLVATAPGSNPAPFGAAEWALLAMVALFWGGSYLFVDIVLGTMGPGLLTLLRLALGAASLAVFPQARMPVSRGDWPQLSLLGLAWMGVPFLLLTLAQQRIDTSLVGVINSSMPLFAALLASLLLRVPPGRSQTLGLIVGFVGVLVMTLPAASGATASTLGVVLAVAATGLFAFAANLAVPLQQRYGALPLILRAQLVSLLVFLPFGLVELGDAEFTLEGILALLVLGVLSGGVAYLAMATLVGRAGPTRGTVAIYFIPIVALILGVGVLHEDVDAEALVGVALVLIGAYAVSRADAAHSRHRDRGASSAQAGRGD